MVADPVAFTLNFAVATEYENIANRESSPVMDVGSFELRALSFEARYAPAYRYYDSSGGVWASFRSRWPTFDLTEQHAEYFKFRGENAEVQLGVKQLSIMHGGKALRQDDLIGQATFLLASAAEAFDISTLSRIGTRVIYGIQFESAEEAADALFSTNFLPRPRASFGIEGPTTFANYGYRVENESLGYLARLMVNKKEIKFDPPIGEMDIPSLNETRHELLYDLDYYTTADADLAQFRVAEWVKQAAHLARRDAQVVLGT